MSELLSWSIVSHSPEVTEEIGAELGRMLRGGEVIELVSDLGGGKTTFVRGLARGLGSHDKVQSPTFTVSREYKTKTITLHHFDFYRLHEAGIVANELAEVAQDPRSVVVVEWGEAVHDILPKNRVAITIKATGESTRQLTFSYPAQLVYLVPSR